MDRQVVNGGQAEVNKQILNWFKLIFRYSRYLIQRND